MSLACIKKGLGQTWNTNIYRIGLTGDSIWRPVGDVVESDGSHPYCGLKLNCMGRMIYDYLDFNKPAWRSIEHDDWIFSGGTEAACGYYGLEHTDKIRIITGAESAEIVITGKDTVVFWFEGGYTGQTIDCGTAQILVKVGSGEYVAPSTTTLKGRKTPVRESQTVVYENIIDTINTNAAYPKSAYSPPSPKSYMPFVEVQYNDLDPNETYTFKISASTGIIRLGGCYYFTGKTCVIQYSAVPGFAWDSLRRTLWNRININDFQLVIANSLIFHDFTTIPLITIYAKAFLWQLLRWHKQKVILVTCTPCGAQIEDAVTTLGDEEPNYVKGQNVMKEFNHRVAYSTTKPAYADYPSRNAIYKVSVSGLDYDLRCTIGKVSAGSYDSWAYNSVLMFEYPTGFPKGSEAYPLTATKQSGDGAASFSLTANYNVPPSFDVHVALMKSIANYFGIEVVDMYQHFADLAVTNGETVETDAYAITEGSPLYTKYPDGMENYLSRYFRPNHWDKSANQPAFECLRDAVFNNFQFK